MTLQVEIIEGHHLPQSREYTDKTTGEVKKSFFQIAYAFLGGAFPTEFKVRIANAAESYAIGKYMITPDSFTVNQYKQLQFGYEMKLQAIK
jgi:hypothetical protein